MQRGPAKALEKRDALAVGYELLRDVYDNARICVLDSLCFRKMQNIFQPGICNETLYKNDSQRSEHAFLQLTSFLIDASKQQWDTSITSAQAKGSKLARLRPNS